MGESDKATMNQFSASRISNRTDPASERSLAFAMLSAYSLITLISGCAKVGTIISVDTSRPISEATVCLYTTYYYPFYGTYDVEHDARTDAEGRYCFFWLFGLFSRVQARMPGYFPNDDSKYGGPGIIKLTRVPKGVLKMKVGVLVHDGKAAEKGFDLLNGKKVTPDKADIVIRPDESDHHAVIVVACGNGGLFPFIPKTTSSPYAEFLQMLEAPAEGYVKEVRLGSTRRILFVRCRDGQHFARIYLEEPDSSKSRPGGGRFMGFLYYVQPDGSRLIPPEPPGL